MSVPQMPAAATFRRISPGTGSGTGTSRSALPPSTPSILQSASTDAGLDVKDVHGPDQLVVDHDDLLAGDSEAVAFPPQLVFVRPAAGERAVLSERVHDPARAGGDLAVFDAGDHHVADEMRGAVHGHRSERPAGLDAEHAVLEMHASFQVEEIQLELGIGRGLGFARPARHPEDRVPGVE